MNYGGVYLRLIDDRRRNPPAAGSYVERHHILPRSLGGGDEDANIIRLTPEDHFFAHLLLAKAYGGGKLWSAVKVMAEKAGGQKSGYARIRRLYGIVKRRFSGEVRGRASPSYDHRVFQFVHADGRKEASTKYDLCQKYGLDIRNLTSVCAGRKKSLGGWTTAEQAAEPGFYFGYKSGNNHHAADLAIYQFRHRDGREISATRCDFASAIGASSQLVTALHSGKANQVRGWYRADRFDQFPTQSMMARRRMPTIALKHVDGRMIEGLRQDITKAIGCRDGEMTRLLDGGLKNVRGWMLPSTDPAIINLGGKPPPAISKNFAKLVHPIHGLFEGSGSQFRQQFYPELSATTSHFAHLMRGRVRSWDGWRLAPQ